MAERELVERLDQAIEAMLAGAPAAASGGDLAALMEIASGLRHLPPEDFKNRLKMELQRRAAMTTSTSRLAGASSRSGLRTITPFLIHKKAPALVDFLKATFGAVELKRDTGTEVYGFYSEVRIGDSVIMIGGGTAAEWGNLPSAFHVF